MGVFKDIKNNSLGDSYGFWGEKPVVEYVTGLLRQYRPDVVVTHDKGGEYGHGAHRVCADAAIRSLTAAMDSKYDIGYGYKLYGNWQPKKLYLHLYGDCRTVIDYDQPLEAFGGKTANELAREAHAMQDYQKKHFPALTGEGVLDGSSFGLYFSAVGDDTGAGDLFEHID